MTSMHHSIEQWPEGVIERENLAYIEDLYAQYVVDPHSVSPPWQHYFSKIALAKHPIDSSNTEQIAHVSVNPSKQSQVWLLQQNYRRYGHFDATLDPLQSSEKPTPPELELSYYELTEQDLLTEFATDVGYLQRASLKEIIQALKQLYCQTVTLEFMYIDALNERRWIQQQYETRFLNKKISHQTKKNILDQLIASEGLEKYLGSRYPGVKRFSLEGNDTLIVAINQLLQKGGETGIKEAVIGMAHRGRLNVLLNTLGKNPKTLFEEFEGVIDESEKMSGDVKYHKGFSSDLITNGGILHVSLAFNPSHLEIISPVVSGSVFARQLRRHDTKGQEVLAVLVHGDAAFSGQGVVMETLNMSKTMGFSIGGAIHVIVNNQIGFTTHRKEEARSTYYCSDLAKMIQAPVFHVNADDPEAIYQVAELAIDYRQIFHKDVMIDLVGYRRHGHNEADEPAVTQPIMYQTIQQLPTVLQKYSQQLIEQTIVTSADIALKKEHYRNQLDAGQNQICPLSHTPFLSTINWQPYFNDNWRMDYPMTVSATQLQQLAKKRDAIPEGWQIHARLKKILTDRHLMTAGSIPMDWGYAETLAYASLVTEGYAVRLVGQDCERGTFFHRHAVYYNQLDGRGYSPLAHLADDQAPFVVQNSLLSEEAVLGFEYGVASCDPKILVIWEAQFGDFANGAQVIIDQFISSAEKKWGRLCGLTVLLPHGYEGQGPEHSSARMERYLQLCAEENIQVCVPSTPAQIFHVLRRQMLRPLRKPLILMTPKSLLRHKKAVSHWEEITDGKFLPILMDELLSSNHLLKRIIFCSGKIYYDLLEEREKQQKHHIALIRIEQLYPFPQQELNHILSNHLSIEDIVWCQEEPQNQGAWHYIRDKISVCLANGQILRYVGRLEKAAPATGYMAVHRLEQSQLIEAALK